MATSYEKIYNRFASKITDFDLASLSDVDLEEILRGYMNSAIANFRRCQNDLSDRDDELRQFNIDLLDIEIEILTILMVREWLRPQLDSVLLTGQVFSDKEQKFYSQAQHMSELRNLDEKLMKDAQRLFNQYTYLHASYWEV